MIIKRNIFIIIIFLISINLVECNKHVKRKTKGDNVCPKFSKLNVDHMNLAFSRPGQLYGNRLYTRFEEGIPENGYPAWKPVTIAISVTLQNGDVPVPNCMIHFETGAGATNGWIYPKHGTNSTTDANGELEVFWVAGSATYQVSLVLISKTFMDLFFRIEIMYNI